MRKHKQRSSHLMELYEYTDQQLWSYDIVDKLFNSTPEGVLWVQIRISIKRYEET